ncbi:MAG: uroporphyrinogen decarboxylase family protein [Promethearchaeota archaeon]
MDERQRIKNCIHFEDVDKIPWQINYTSEIAKIIMRDLNIKEPKYFVLGKNIFKYNYLDDFFGNHIIYLRNRAVNSVVEETPGLWRDEWGVLWDRRLDKDIGVPVNCLLDKMQLKDIVIPDPDDPDRYAHFWPLIKSNSQRYLLVKFSYSLFERAWSLRGMENLMIDFIDNPSFVHELFGTITEFNLKIMKNLKNFPIDGVQFGDDWGGQRGLLMSPDTWRKFIKPYLVRMYNQAHAQGYDVFIHSCGNIIAILDDLIDIGVNVFNPFQPEVMDLENIIDKYSHRLAFYGGLSIQKTLPFGKPNEVRQEVEHRLNLAYKYNGLIISPSHDMPPDIPLKNILTMLKILKH